MGERRLPLSITYYVSSPVEAFQPICKKMQLFWAFDPKNVAFSVDNRANKW
jgi:hypothetical protein